MLYFQPLNLKPEALTPNLPRQVAGRKHKRYQAMLENDTQQKIMLILSESEVSHLTTYLSLGAIGL